MRKLIVMLFPAICGLAGCASATETIAPVSTVSPTAEVALTDIAPPPAVIAATEPPAAAEPPATTTEPVTATAALADPSSPTIPLVVYGRTDEGAYFHGAADAPVTLLDYSDFL
jgi:hypothetical protein